MPTEHILALLLAERQKLDAAIQALGGTTAKRRGRPPKNPLANAPSWVTGKPEPTKKRIVSVAQRKKQAAAMRKFWRNKKKATKTSAATA